MSAMVQLSMDINVDQRVAIGVTSGLFVLTTFVVYVRLYIRCILKEVGSAGYDDLTVFIAWVSKRLIIIHLGTPTSRRRNGICSPFSNSSWQSARLQPHISVRLPRLGDLGHHLTASGLCVF